VPVEYAGAVIVIAFDSVADANVTVPVLEMFVAVAALPVVDAEEPVMLIPQLPDAPVPVRVGAKEL
jgi:hypothetical protein